MYYELISQDTSINEKEYITHQSLLNHSETGGYPVLADTKRQASYYLEEEGVTEFLSLFVVLPIGFDIFMSNNQFFIYPQFEKNKEWGFWANQIYPLQNNKWSDYQPLYSETTYSKALEIKELLESVYLMSKTAAAESAISAINSLLLGK